VSAAGLAPVLALAEQSGLHQLVAEHLTVPGSAGANTVVQIPALVAGMVAGADSIEDMGLLRQPRRRTLRDAPPATGVEDDRVDGAQVYPLRGEHRGTDEGGTVDRVDHDRLRGR